MARPDCCRRWWYVSRSLLIGLLTGWMLTNSMAATERPDAALEPVRAQLRLKHYAAAIKLLQPMAERGEATAELWLANLYRNGLGIDVDDAMAMQWLRRAADHGQTQAMYELAARLAEQDPVPHAEVTQWLQRAAQAGHALAQHAVKEQLLPDRFTSRQLTEQAARCEAFWLAAAHNQVSELTAFNEPALIQAVDEFGRHALHYAARRGAVEATNWLLAAGATADRSDSAGVTALMLAARHGHVNVLTTLLQQHSSPLLQDRLGNNALMYAIANGQRAAIDALLPGSDLQQRNVQGWSALDWALQQADTSTVNILKSRGLTSARKVSVASQPPAVPLQRAANADWYRGWPDILIASTRSTELLDAVLQANPASLRGNEAAALLAAVQADNTALVERLLARGLIDTSTSDETALSWAVRHEQLTMVNLLLARGIAADAHGKREPAPLLSAARLTSSHALALVDVLLKAGANPDRADAQGNTALMYSINTRQPALTERLLQSGAQPDLANRQGKTALMLAASNRCLECLKALLGAKANLDKRDGDGSTALLLAVANGDGAAASALLAAGASQQVANTIQSPLMLAALRGDDELIKKLLAAGSKVDWQDRHGDTALMLAARGGQSQAIKLLLAAGADRSLRNNDRASARDIAERLAFKDLVALLDQRS